MKLIKLTVCVLLSLLFVQCDSAERRKSRAEDAIKDILFETIDDYQSYEKISTEVDTLKDLWMVNQEIVGLGRNLVDTKWRCKLVQGEIEEMEGKRKSAAISASNSLWSNNGWGFWSGYAKMSEYENKIKKLKESLKGVVSDREDLEGRIAGMCDTLRVPEKPYWLVKHKCRYAGPGNNVAIHTINYIFDAKVKEMLFSWEEGDFSVEELINTVNSVKGIEYDPDLAPEPVDTASA